MKSKRTKGLMSQSRARFAVSSAWQIHFRTQALIIDNPFSHTNLSMRYGIKSQKLQFGEAIPLQGASQ